MQNEFPEMEPNLEIGLQFEFGPRRIGQALLPPRQRMRYRHKDRPLLLQLGQQVFTVNVLPKYPGWERMRKDVIAAWRQAKAALTVDKVTRIGLRYINRIERRSKSERPSDWFRANDYIPACVLNSRGAYFSRAESQDNDDNRVIVTLAESQQDGKDEPAFTLDIDRIVEKELPLDDDKLLEQMDRLHDHVWEIFKASQTPPLLKHLKGERK